MTSCSVHRLLGAGEFTDTTNRMWCGLFTGKVADGLDLKLLYILYLLENYQSYSSGHRYQQQSIAWGWLRESFALEIMAGVKLTLIADLGIGVWWRWMVKVPRTNIFYMVSSVLH